MQHHYEAVTISARHAPAYAVSDKYVCWWARLFSSHLLTPACTNKLTDRLYLTYIVLYLYFNFYLCMLKETNGQSHSCLRAVTARPRLCRTLHARTHARTEKHLLPQEGMAKRSLTTTLICFCSRDIIALLDHSWFINEFMLYLNHMPSNS